jgi:hypothetical protein
VDTGKFALVAPAATPTLAGTVATALLPLESVTSAPLSGAGALSVTVPVEALPAATLAGLTLKEESVTATTLRTIDRVWPPYATVIVTAVAPVTAVVDSAKLALVDPAGTVAMAGTVTTAGLLLESATAAPPAGAGALRTTVPVAAVPPLTVAGSRLKEESVAAAGRVSWRYW